MTQIKKRLKRLPMPANTCVPAQNDALLRDGLMTCCDLLEQMEKMRLQIHDALAALEQRQEQRDGK